MTNRDLPASAPSPIPAPPDFPVTWNDDVETALLWTWDEFHAPLPRSPMMQSVSELTRQGMEQAMRETGRYSPGGRRKVINGYPYSASSRRELSEAEKRTRQEMIDRAIADARGRWDAEWLPKLEQDLEQMKAVDLGALDDRELIAPDDSSSAELTGLRGTPASPGEATGVAVIVMSPADFGKVRPGNVLVCRSTAPMWTPLFGVVAGLISEAGGILSHPAVVAREFGLPAVVGVRSATNLIKDGQLLTVSGSSGLITW